MAGEYLQSDGPEWLSPLLAAIGTAVAGVLLWLGQRAIGRAAFQAALNDGFSKLTQELRGELEGSRQEYAKLRKLVEAEQAANQTLKAEMRTLVNIISELERRIAP